MPLFNLPYTYIRAMNREGEGFTLTSSASFFLAPLPRPAAPLRGHTTAPTQLLMNGEPVNTGKVIARKEVPSKTKGKRMSSTNRRPARTPRKRWSSPSAYRRLLALSGHRGGERRCLGGGRAQAGATRTGYFSSPFLIHGIGFPIHPFF